jgi:flagellar motor component MotA
MRLFQHSSMMLGLIILLAVGCDNSTEVVSNGKKSPDQTVTEQTTVKATVSPAVEGAHPAVADREKDMTLVARETQQNETEQEAIRKDMEKAVRQAEREQAAPQ